MKKRLFIGLFIGFALATLLWVGVYYAWNTISCNKAYSVAVTLNTMRDAGTLGKLEVEEIFFKYDPYWSQTDDSEEFSHFTLVYKCGSGYLEIVFYAPLDDNPVILDREYLFSGARLFENNTSSHNDYLWIENLEMYSDKTKAAYMEQNSSD